MPADDQRRFPISCRVHISESINGGLTGRTREAAMNIADKTVLVTGANRGIGHALTEEAL